MTTCKARLCDRESQAIGYCISHYKRHRNGKPLNYKPLRVLATCSLKGCEVKVSSSKEIPFCEQHRHRRVTGNTSPIKDGFINKGKSCAYEKCDAEARTHAHCSGHYAQIRRGEKPHNFFKPTGSYINNQGYKLIFLPGNPHADKRGWTMEHRKAMADYLGRPLLKDENVHHINGIRDDNRLSNLELWSSSQPSGQRVKDKVEWAKMILARYEAVK